MELTVEELKMAKRVRRGPDRQQPLDDYIRGMVDEAPPLTVEQRDKLRVLLAPAVAEIRRERLAKERDRHGE